MGCGPSRVNISRFRLRKKKNSQDKGLSNNNAHENENDILSHRKKSPTDFYVERNSTLGEDIGSAKIRIANKIRPISGPLQPPLHRSSSQIDFFRMLDEKIANGQDYNSEEDEEERRLKQNAFREGRRLQSISKGSHYFTKSASSAQRRLTFCAEADES